MWIALAGVNKPSEYFYNKVADYKKKYESDYIHLNTQILCGI
jgi:hypothetical protein